MKIKLKEYVFVVLILLVSCIAFHYFVRMLEAQQLVAELYFNDAISHAAIKQGKDDVAVRYLEMSAREVAQYTVSRRSTWHTDLVKNLYRTSRAGFITGIADPQNEKKLDELHEDFDSDGSIEPAWIIAELNYWIGKAVQNYYDTRRKWGHWGEQEPKLNFLANGHIRLPLYTNSMNKAENKEAVRPATP